MAQGASRQSGDSAATEKVSASAEPRSAQADELAATAEQLQQLVARLTLDAAAGSHAEAASRLRRVA